MSTWDLWSFDYGKEEFWARRVDRKVSDAEEGLGFRRYICADSAVERGRLIEEQDLLEAKYNGAKKAAGDGERCSCGKRWDDPTHGDPEDTADGAL